MIILQKSPGGIARARQVLTSSFKRVENSMAVLDVGKAASRATMSTTSLSDISESMVYINQSIVRPGNVQPTVRTVFPPPSLEAADRQKELARRLSRIRSHLAAFGFIRGRSCHKAALTHAAYWGFPTQGDVSYLKADMRNFFHSVDGDKVQRAFDAHGISWVGIDDLLECGALMDMNIGRDPANGFGGIADQAFNQLFGQGNGPSGFRLSDVMLWTVTLERLLEICPREDWEEVDRYCRSAVEKPKAATLPKGFGCVTILSTLGAFSAERKNGGTSMNKIAKAFPLTALLAASIGDTIVNAGHRSSLLSGDLLSFPSIPFNIGEASKTLRVFNDSRGDKIPVEQYMPSARLQVETILRVVRSMADMACDTLSLPRANQNSLFTPQGASTSPALSNLAAKPLDYRMAAMAADESLCYTRYADDLTFSWSGRRTKKELGILKWKISKGIKSLGFVPNLRKFIVMGPGMRQKVLGYAMNSGRPTIPGPRRKAILAEATRLMESDTGHETRGEILRDLKRTAGLLAWCYEAHRTDQRIIEARAQVDIHMKRVLSGGMSLHGDLEMSIDNFDDDSPGNWRPATVDDDLEVMA